MSEKDLNSGVSATASDIKYTNLRLDKQDGVWTLVCENVNVTLPERVQHDKKPTIDVDDSSAYITTTDESVYEVKITNDGSIVWETLEEATFSAADGKPKCGDGAGNREDHPGNHEQSQQCVDIEKKAVTGISIETGIKNQDEQKDDPKLSRSHEEIPNDAVKYTDLELKEQDGVQILTCGNSIIPLPVSNARHFTLFTDDSSACIVTNGASLYEVKRTRDGKFICHDKAVDGAGADDIDASAMKECDTKYPDDKCTEKIELEEGQSGSQDTECIRKQKQVTEGCSGQQVEHATHSCNRKAEESHSEYTNVSDSKDALRETFGETNEDANMHRDSVKLKDRDDKCCTVTESSFKDFVVLNVPDSGMDKADTRSTTDISDKHELLWENFAGKSKVTVEGKGSSKPSQHNANQQEGIPAQVSEMEKQCHIDTENTSVRTREDGGVQHISATAVKESDSKYDNDIDTPFATLYQVCDAAPQIFDDIFVPNKSENVRENKESDVLNSVQHDKSLTRTPCNPTQDKHEIPGMNFDGKCKGQAEEEKDMANVKVSQTFSNKADERLKLSSFDQTGQQDTEVGLKGGESTSIETTGIEASSLGIRLEKKDSGWKLFVGGKCFLLPNSYKDEDKLELKIENGTLAVIVTQGNNVYEYGMDTREQIEETREDDDTASVQQEEHIDRRDLLLLKDATGVSDLETLNDSCCKSTADTKETDDGCQQNRRFSEIESESKSIHSEKGMTVAAENAEIVTGTNTSAVGIGGTQSERNLFETTGEFSFQNNHEKHLPDKQTYEVPCHEPFVETSSNTSPEPNDSYTLETTFSKSQNEIESEHVSSECAKDKAPSVASFDTADGFIQKPDEESKHTRIYPTVQQQKQARHVADKASSEAHGLVDLKTHQIGINNSNNTQLGSTNSSKFQTDDKDMKDRDSVLPSTEMSSEEQRRRDAKLEEILNAVGSTSGTSSMSQSSYGGARPKQYAGNWLKSMRGERTAVGDPKGADMAVSMDKGKVRPDHSEAGTSRSAVGLGKGHATAGGSLGSERAGSGMGTSPVQTQGTSPVQPQGTSPVQTQGTSPVQTQGTSPVQTQGTGPVQTQGTGPVQTQGTSPVQTQGTSPVQTQGTGSVQTQGTSPVQTQGTSPVQTQGTSPVQTQGTSPVQTQGTSPVQTQGTSPVQTQGTSPVQTQGTGPVQTQYKDTGVASLKDDDSMHPSDKLEANKAPSEGSSAGEECMVTGVDSADRPGDCHSTYEIQYTFYYYLSGQPTRKKMEKKFECSRDDYLKWRFVLYCPRKIQKITTSIFKKTKINAEITEKEAKFKQSFYNVDQAVKMCDSSFQEMYAHTYGLKVECFPGLQKPEFCANKISNSGYGSDKAVQATVLASGELVCVYEREMEAALHGYFKKEIEFNPAWDALKVPEASRPSVVMTFSQQLEAVWIKLAEKHPIKEIVEKEFSEVEISFEMEDESCAMKINGTQDIANKVIKHFHINFELKLLKKAVALKVNHDVFRETDCCQEIQANLDKERLKCVIEFCDDTGLTVSALDQNDIDSAVRKVSRMMKEERIILRDQWKQTENFNKLKEDVSDVLITVEDSGTSAVVTGLKDKVVAAVNVIKSKMDDAINRINRTFLLENRDHFLLMKNDREFQDHLQNMHSVRITEIDIGERQGFEMHGEKCNVLECEHLFKEYIKDIVNEDLEFSDMETTTWLKSDHGKQSLRDVESTNCVKLDMKQESTGQIMQHVESEDVEIKLNSNKEGRSTWLFPNGHKLIVYRVLLQNARTDISSKIVEVDNHAGVGNIGISAGIWKVNIPKYTSDADISQTKRIFKKLLETAEEKSLAIEVPMLNSWTMYGLMSCLVQGFGEYFLEVAEDTHPAFAVLCPERLTTFDALIDECQKAVRSLGKKPCTTPAPKVNVCVKIGSLSDTKADVLVNTTSSNLDLSNGAVSKALSRKAGPKMQDECNARHNKSLTPGEVAVTNGYKLDCKHVFHCSIPGYKNPNSLQHITQIVTGCLMKATDYKATSIAFPAIGTGNLSYPVGRVAEEMFDCVDQFIEEGKPTSLETIMFVVFSGDANAVTQFRKNEEQRKEMLTSSSASAKPIASPREAEKIQMTITGREENVKRAGKQLKEAAKRQCQTYYMRIPENVQSLIASKTGNMEELHRKIEKLGVVFIEEKASILLQANSTQMLQTALQVIEKFSQEKYRRTLPISTNFYLLQRRQAVSEEQYGLFCFFHSSLLKKCNHDQVKVSHHGDTLVIDGKLEKVVVVKTEIFKIIDQPLNGLFKKEVKLEGCQGPVDVAIEAMQERSTKVYFRCDDLNSPTVVYIYGYERGQVNEAESGLRQKLSQMGSQSTGTRQKDQATGSAGAARKPAPMESLSFRPDGKARTFKTREKLIVKVYQGDLLDVRVDAIVNAANSSLQHFAGVAAAIADAAGEELKSESTNYVRVNGPVPVGKAIKTSAGKLPLKCVIHAVGPEWSRYAPHTEKDIERCKTNLSQTIYNSLLVADNNKVKSVAIPAISSALFGVPKDLCAAEYAEAVIHYSDMRFKRPGQWVEEVHFVDKDDEMVKKITATFKVMIEDGKPSPYNIKAHVKQTPKQNAPMSPNHRSSSSSDQGNASSSTAQKPSAHPGLAVQYPQYIDDGSKMKCRFNENHEVCIYNGDILKLKGVHAIVCSEDPSGKAHGIVAKKLLEKGKFKYDSAKKDVFRRKCSPGEVLITIGGENEYRFVMHALVPQQSSGRGWDTDLKKMLAAIFDKAALHKFPSVVMSLLGTGSGGSDPTVCARALLDSYTVACNRNKAKPLVLHVVNIDTAKTNTVKQVFQYHIQTTMKHQGGGMAQASSTTQPSGLDVQSGKVKYSDVVKVSPAAQPGSSTAAGNKAPAAKAANPKSSTSTVSSIYPKLPGSSSKPESPKSTVSPAYPNLPMSTASSIKPKSPAPAVPALTFPAAADQPGKVVDKKATQDTPEEQCVICMDKMDNPKTLKCGHKFCTECIDQHFKFKQTCPVCGAVLGVVTGDQPDGEMEIMFLRNSLAGYESVGTVAVSYSFKDGKQGPDNPRPGSFYAGISRTGYLPDTEEGRKICALLKQAFKRRLIFTIGRSRTTGQEGVITWNDIHHKTDHRPNGQFGYPDPGYLDRVKDELAAKGVTEATIDHKFLKKLTPGQPYRFIIKTDKK